MQVARAQGASAAVGKPLGWPNAPRRFLRRLLRWFLVGNASLLAVLLVSALVFHTWAARTPTNFEDAISWSTRYILMPSHLAKDHGIPPSSLRPLARVIETVFIRSASLGPARDGHLYWQGRLLQPMAATFGRLQSPDDQLRCWQNSVDLFAALVVRQPSHLEYRRRLTRSHQLMAEDLLKLDRHAEAISHFQSALQLAEDLQRAEPDNPRWHLYEALAQLPIGEWHAREGRHEEAAVQLARGHQRVLAMQERFPAEPQWQQVVAKFEKARDTLKLK